MSELLPQSTMPCRNCQGGVMHLQYITYFTWLDEEMVTVPNFPAWVCDICGIREYDERAVTWLITLLNPNAGRPNRQFAPRRPRGGKKPSATRPTTSE